MLVSMGIILLSSYLSHALVRILTLFPSIEDKLYNKSVATIPAAIFGCGEDKIKIFM